MYMIKVTVSVKIATVNPRLAAIIISQYGGPDGGWGNVPAVSVPALCHAL